MTTLKHDAKLYSRLFQYVKPYRVAFFISCAAMAIGGLVEGSFAFFLKYMLGDLFNEGSTTNAMWAAFGIVGIFLVSGLSHFVAGYGMQWVSHKIILDIRNEMFHRLIRAPAILFDNQTSGVLMSRVTNDVIGIQDAATSALTALIRGGATLIMLLITMFTLNWKLTLIAFVTIPILGLIVSAFGKRLRNISRQGQVAHAGLTDVLAESIRGQKIIKLYGGEAHESARFDQSSNRIRQLAMKYSVAASAATPFTHIIVAIAIAFIVFLAISNKFGGGMPVESFVAFIVSAAALVPQIKGLASVSERIQKGLAAAESVFSLVDTPGELDNGTIALPAAQGNIRFESVGLQYAGRDKPALENITIEIKPGETIALVGGSGGGKTSFVNLIPRFLSPTQGKIYLDDHLLDDIRLTDLRQQIAMVSQDVVLFNDTVAANIAYGVVGAADENSEEKIIAAAEAANCMDFINALPQGMETNIGENGMRLSGGQRQRLAIARAIYKNAPILLLDEATSSLDAESEKAVQSALDRLIAGRTTIVVAHRLSTIENATRIVVINAGKIAEVGAHQELLKKNGVYAALYRLQFSAAQ